MKPHPLLAVLLLCAACSEVPREAAADCMRKVEFDLSHIDGDGLRGPADGKVAVSYEFCIPDTDA